MVFKKDLICKLHVTCSPKKTQEPVKERIFSKCVCKLMYRPVTLKYSPGSQG